MHKAYALVLGQLTRGLKNKLQTRKYWVTHIKNQPIGILEEIKDITQNYQDIQYTISSIFKVIKTVVNLKQGKKESLAAFNKCFKNDKDIMDPQHGNLTLSKYIKTLPGYDASKLEKLKLHSEESYN